MATALRSQSMSNDYYGALKSRGPEIVAKYRALTPKSRALFERAGNCFPGGFTRDAIMRSPYAPFVVSAQGTTMTDVDGRTINDVWFNATSLPHGHAHPEVVRAASRQVTKGSAYFAPTEHEMELAELLISRIPSAERIRFANSGSEAVMMAVRFARAFRGRRLVVKFEGSYHGSYDDVSWSVSPAAERVGPADAPVPVAETSGLAGTEGRLAVLPFNDVAALRAFVEANHASIAAVLIEPLANRMGLILPDKAWLAGARDLCSRHDIVLIFDEVIAFRIGYEGAQGQLGVTPDLTTLGKIIGGGFPVGAIAGRADVLDRSARGQVDRVTHAGTFNANPMVAVSGLATMRLLTRDTFASMNSLGAVVREELAAVCVGFPIQVTGTGSLFKITATDQPISNYRDAMTADKTWEETASLALLNEGFLLTPTLSGCVSSLSTRRDLDGFFDAFRSIVNA